MTETTLALNTTAQSKHWYEKLDRYWANGEILVGLVMLLIVLL